MKTTYSVALLVAMAIAPALRVSTLRAMESGTTPLKAIQDAQLSQGSYQTEIQRAAYEKHCTVQSVYAPAMELVVVDESGLVRTETLSNTVLINDGEQILAVNDLQPGDTIRVVQNDRGEIIKVDVLSRA